MAKKSPAFKLQTSEKGMATLLFDLPKEKVNKLSIAVMEELDAHLADIEKRQDLHGLIVASGKKDIFIAGADISEIEGIKDPKKGKELAAKGQEVLGRLENLPFPVVAAIDGATLGGGMELALACHYRVITNRPKTVMGLPEVKLGIHPGFGGTQRLPRLIGIRNSLDIILTGKNIYPKKALRLGLADKMVPQEYLMDQAIKTVEEKAKPSYKRPTGLRKKPALVDRALELTSYGRDFIFKKAEESVMKRTRGNYPSTLKAIQVMKEGLSLHLEGGLAIEASGLGEMAATGECKNLISVFYLQETLRKETFVGKDVETTPIDKAAVLGAGVMGGGIAQLFAEKDIPVRMKDINNDALGHGLKSAAHVFKGKLKKRIIDKGEFDRKMGNISTTLDYSGFDRAQIIVEAIVEKMEVKKAVFGECEGQVKDDTILASNTSSLSITEMATALKKPERFAGMHFFNPVHRMPLVEVIRGEKTSDETTATIVALSKKLGKTPVVVKDKEGFLVNRLLMPYLNEAVCMLEEGATIDEVDETLLNFGMPMGAFILLDEIGIDIAWHVAEILHKAFGERMKPAGLMKSILDSGRLGRKNGKGYYSYDGKKRKGADKSVYSLTGGKKGGALSSTTIIDRSVLLMLNEAALCLEEEIVARPEHVDGGMIFGTGFPPFRGGLLRYADSRGVKEIVNILEQFKEKYGERFEPAPLLKEMAKKGKSFYK
ncbi:MAG: 3-hydroxyacyl-CoA dehydrogenase NAD-binding domain-containing protein [Deltaproteobacteria bacterium]|nr:3-hydroxyacyl-CoA dehydrogenase NAD-binding domain-containing protein [Deltaproteobacteria bacterium]